MSSILHFANDGDGKAACGTKIILCDDYTDDQHHVECGRCKKTKAFINYDPRRFNVDVWTWEGDVVRSAKATTADDVEHIKNLYADNPTVQVVVEEL